jgi:molybdopterin/thiamine biosynthesis adenylyltransferase
MGPDGYDARFSHNIGVITAEEQEKLRSARVAIAGVGGVGGNAAHILARTGIGAFTLADPDTFTEGNINRQYGACPATLGERKVDVVAREIRRINPDAAVSTFPEGLTVENVEGFLGDADVVVDGVDFLSPDVRKALVDACRRRGLYSFLCPAFGFGASLVVFSPGGPSYDEFFGELPAETSAKTIVAHGQKIFPVVPDYVDLKSYVLGMKGESHVPTFAPPVVLAAALTASDLILALTGRKKPVCVPKVKWIDLMEMRLRVIDVRLREKLILPQLLLAMRLRALKKELTKEGS